jgi:hypothetical protein
MSHARKATNMMGSMLGWLRALNSQWKISDEQLKIALERQGKSERGKKD